MKFFYSPKRPFTQTVLQKRFVLSLQMFGQINASTYQKGGGWIENILTHQKNMSYKWEGLLNIVLCSTYRSADPCEGSQMLEISI